MEAASLVTGQKSDASDFSPPEEMRSLEMRPILKLVTPLKRCPECKGKAELEWREDGDAVRAGCPKCSASVEAKVARETVIQEGDVRKLKPVASLQTRQKSAQAEVVENWNLWADGFWDLRSGKVPHIRTAIEPDWSALNAKPESEKPH